MNKYTKKEKFSTQKNKDTQTPEEKAAAFLRYLNRKLEKSRTVSRRKARIVEAQMFSVLSAVTGASNATERVMETVLEQDVVGHMRDTMTSVRTVSDRVDSLLSRIERAFGEHGKKIYSKIAFTSIRLARDHSLFNIILVVLELLWDFTEILFDPIEYIVRYVWPFVQRAVEILALPLQVRNRELPVEGQVDFEVKDLDWPNLIPIGAGIAAIIGCASYGLHTMGDREAMRAMTSCANYASNLTKIKGGIKTAWDFVQYIIEQVRKSLVDLCPTLMLGTSTRDAFLAQKVDLHEFVQIVNDLTTRSNRMQILTSEKTPEKLAEAVRISHTLSLLLVEKKVVLTPGVQRVLEGVQKKLFDFVREYEVDNASQAIRPTPFHVSFYGDPGCGKSNLAGFFATDLVNPEWCKTGVDPTIPPYTRNSADRYWSGYIQQPVVIIDDSGQTRGEAPSVSEYLEMIFMISGVAWRPVMNRNEDKGIQFNSRLIISTTNTPFPTPTEVMAPKAIWRRRNFLVRVKPARGASNMALNDPKRATFDIMEPCPAQGQEEVICENLTYLQLLQHVIPVMNEFDKMDKQRVPFASLLSEEDKIALRQVEGQVWSGHLPEYDKKWKKWIERLREIRKEEFNTHIQIDGEDFQASLKDDELAFFESVDMVCRWDRGPSIVYISHWTDEDLKVLQRTRAEPWRYIYCRDDYYRFGRQETRIFKVGVDFTNNTRENQNFPFCKNCGTYDCIWRYSDNADWLCVPYYYDVGALERFWVPERDYDRDFSFYIDYSAYRCGLERLMLVRRSYNSGMEVRYDFSSLPKWGDLLDIDKHAIALAFANGVIDITDNMRSDMPMKKHELIWNKKAGKLDYHWRGEKAQLEWKEVKYAWKFYLSTLRRSQMLDYERVVQAQVEDDDSDFIDDMFAAEEREREKCFMEKLVDYPHVKQLVTVLGVVTAMFGMYKMYQWLKPAEKRQGEGFFARSAEQKWLYDSFNNVHQHYIAQQPISPQQAKNWADETQEVYDMYRDLKAQGQDFEKLDATDYWKYRSRRLKQFESGGGPSGDSRTMKKAMARVVRREDELVLTEEHEGLNEDGKRYTHCHECVKCGDIFSHTHKIQRANQDKYVHLCRACVKRSEGCEDDAALSLLQDSIAPRNCVVVKAEGRRMCGLGLTGRILLMPWHFFAGLSGEITLEVVRHQFGSTLHCVRIGREVVRMRSAGKDVDLVLVSLGGSIPCFPDIVKHIVRDSDLGKMERVPGQITRVKIDGTRTVINNSEHVMINQMHDEVGYSVLDGSILRLKGLSYRTATRKGDCGAIACVLNTRVDGFIAGMHVAGDPNVSEGFSAFLTREMVQSEIERIGWQDDNIRMAQMQGFEFGNEQFSVYPEGNLVIVGQAHGQDVERFPKKTDIIPSPLHGLIREPTTFPSVLLASDPRVEDNTFSPMEKGLKKYAEPMHPFSPSAMDSAEEEITNMLRKFAPKGVGKRLLSLHEAINGVPLAGYQRINMLTSPGRPYKKWRPAGSKGKRFLFEELGDEQYGIANNQFGEELLERFVKRLKAAEKGERVFSYSYANLKDERRKEKKIKAGATRVFDCLPMDYNLLCRQYFGAFVATMNQNHTVLPQSVGIDPSGPGWSRLYQRLNRFGGDVFAGDYELWDGKFDGESARRVVRIINVWYRKDPHNPTKEELRAEKVRAVLLDEMIHTYVLAGNTMMLTSQGLPSGVVVTADINSIQNLFYFVTAFYAMKDALKSGNYSLWDGTIEVSHPDVLKENKFICDRMSEKLMALEQDAPLKYFDNVESVFYGDDHVIAPSMRIRDWFNFWSIRNYLSVHNIGYTDAAKSGKLTPKLERLTEVTYLKRRFVPHPEFRDRVRAPIDENTIYEEINWIRKSEDDVAALYQNLATVKREAYQHGESFYNDIVTKINQCINVKQSMDLQFGSYSVWELLTRDYEAFDCRWLEQFNN